MAKPDKADKNHPDPFWLDHRDRANRSHFWRRPSKREQRREETVRDWFGSELARGEISARQRPPGLIGPALDSLMQELGKGRQVLLEQIIDNWPNLVGPDIARQTQPRGLYDKCLEVEVSHAMWLYELQTRLKPQLTNKIAEFSKNQVASLRFVPAGRRRLGT